MCNDQLGRGCQSGLALTADIPLAAPNGQFGQLDVNTGSDLALSQAGLAHSGSDRGLNVGCLT